VLIDNVEAIPIEVPLRKVFSGSGYRVDSRCMVITRIHTADGLVSEVYNGDNSTHGRTIAHIVEGELAPLLIGAGAVDLVNFDASEAGGITESRRAATMCAIH
jgi:D-galactarolactone cycloisomerase